MTTLAKAVADRFAPLAFTFFCLDACFDLFLRHASEIGDVALKIFEHFLFVLRGKAISSQTQVNFGLSNVFVKTLPTGFCK
jgi:hypothetical protein